MKSLYTYCVYLFLTVFCAGSLSPTPVDKTQKAQISTLAPLVRNEQPHEKLLRLSNSYKQTRSPETLKELILFLNLYMQPALCNASAYPCVNMSDKRNEAGLFYATKPVWKTHYPVSCILAARFVEQIVPVLFPDIKVYRVCLSTKLKERRMSHYVSLLFDTRSGRYFYLSFTDGQFETAPEGMQKYIPALRADAENRHVMVSTPEYLEWYLENGHHVAVIHELNLVVNATDTTNTVCNKLETAIAAKTNLNGQFEAVNWYERPELIQDSRLLSQIDPAIKELFLGLFKLQQNLQLAA